MTNKRNFVDLIDATHMCDNKYEYNGRIFYTKPMLFQYGEDIDFTEEDLFKFHSREIIAEEVAKFLGVETLHYEIGIINGQLCVFSNQFFRKNEEYITGDKLLKDYFEILKKSNNLDGSYNSESLNNLTDIWGALETFYGSEHTADIEKIMENLIRVFCFDILTGNIDRHTGNWGIIRNEDNIRLVPMYDNQLFLNFISIAKIGVDGKEKKVYDPIERLSKFLAISDPYFTDIFYDMYDKLTPDRLESIFMNVENSRNIPVDKDDVRKTIDSYSQHRNNLQTVVEQYRYRKR